MVDLSPWPLFISIAVSSLLLSTVNYFNGFLPNEILILLIALFAVLFIMFLWFSDIINESTFQGFYTLYVQKNITLGMILFLVSEAMFFFSFFWSFFHYSLNPSVHTGCVWPVFGIIPVNPYHLPLLNTFVLVMSGVYATASHFHMSSGVSGPIEFKTNFFAGNIFLIGLKESLIVSIALGIIFIYTQGYEFSVADFGITDSVYGSIFYILTGFHGLHVIIGVIFLLVSLFRYLKNHFFYETHLGFLFSVWYWHFVDIIWIFVYLFVYIWGGSI